MNQDKKNNSYRGYRSGQSSEGGRSSTRSFGGDTRDGAGRRGDRNNHGENRGFNNGENRGFGSRSNREDSRDGGGYRDNDRRPNFSNKRKFDGSSSGFAKKRKFDGPPPEIKRYLVSADFSGTVEQWFSSNFKEIPAVRLGMFSERRSLRVDGQPTNLASKLAVGQEISFPETMFSAGIKNNSDRPAYSDRRGGGDRNRDGQSRGFGNGRERAERGSSRDRDSSFRSRGHRDDRGENRSANRQSSLAGTPKYQLLCNSIQSWVISKDDNLIALNKPAGSPVQGGTNVDVSIDDLIHVFADYKSKLKLVHRLDSGTSGVLIVAMHVEAAVELGRMFHEHKMDKKYLAVLIGVPAEREGILDYPLAKKSFGNDREMVRHDEDGKSAVTRYKVLSDNGFLSLVEFIIDTGRTHQIRVHSAMMGCPVLGDRKYSQSEDLPQALSEEQMEIQSSTRFMHLHASNLQFTLFDTKYDITADLPEYFSQTISKYKL